MKKSIKIAIILIFLAITISITVFLVINTKKYVIISDEFNTLVSLTTQNGNLYVNVTVKNEPDSDKYDSKNYNEMFYVSKWSLFKNINNIVESVVFDKKDLIISFKDKKLGTKTFDLSQNVPEWINLYYEFDNGNADYRNNYFAILMDMNSDGMPELFQIHMGNSGGYVNYGKSIINGEVIIMNDLSEISIFDFYLLKDKETGNPICVGSSIIGSIYVSKQAYYILHFDDKMNIEFEEKFYCRIEKAAYNSPYPIEIDYRINGNEVELSKEYLDSIPDFYDDEAYSEFISNIENSYNIYERIGPAIDFKQVNLNFHGMYVDNYEKCYVPFVSQLKQWDQ